MWDFWRYLVERMKNRKGLLFVTERSVWNGWDTRGPLITRKMYMWGIAVRLSLYPTGISLSGFGGRAAPTKAR